MLTGKMVKSAALILALAAGIGAACVPQKPRVEPALLPPIRSICIQPVSIISSDPELSAQQEEKIGKVLQAELTRYVGEISGLDVRAGEVSEGCASEACDASLCADIAFLQLVEKQDTETSAVTTVAGVTLLALTGFGFVSVPSAQMTVNLQLTAEKGTKVVWKKTEQVSVPAVYLDESYPKQALALADQLRSRLQREFPYQKKEQ